MIHDNPTRNKQKKTTKEKRLDSSIIIDALGKMNDRRKAAENAGDYAALERLAKDYEAIGLTRLAGDIRRELPKAMKLL